MIASLLNAPYIEADDFHSHGNRTAMAKNIPLTDEMRAPWLKAVAMAAATKSQQEPVVLACSALKRKYRDVLRAHIPQVRFVFLSANRDVIADRMKTRVDHFLPEKMLDSQLATLEPPTDNEEVFMVDAGATKEQLNQHLKALLAGG